jgi:hypothetical protein
MLIKDRNFCKPSLSQKMNKEQLCEYEMPTASIHKMRSILFINQLAYLICKLLPLENFNI